MAECTGIVIPFPVNHRRVGRPVLDEEARLILTWAAIGAGLAEAGAFLASTSLSLGLFLQVMPH